MDAVPQVLKSGFGKGISAAPLLYLFMYVFVCQGFLSVANLYSPLEPLHIIC